MMKNHPVKKCPHLRFGIIPFIFISMLPPPTPIVNTNFLTTSVITDKMDICPFCSSTDSGNIYHKSADFLYSPAENRFYILSARESRFFRCSTFSELFSNYLRLIYYLKWPFLNKNIIEQNRSLRFFLLYFGGFLWAARDRQADSDFLLCPDSALQQIFQFPRAEFFNFDPKIFAQNQ